MCLKVHLLHTYLDNFSLNLYRREGFHQEMKIMEESYQGQWSVNMLGDYCWTIRREES